MVKLILLLLPARYRLLLEMGLRIGKNLNTAEEIKAVAVELDAITKDGRISVSEWAKFGSTLGIYGSSQKSHDDEDVIVAPTR
jgi:hypothetical protein